MTREMITELIARQTNMTVQVGPFAGMRISPETSWGDGDSGPKLLGTYEQELHPHLVHATSRSYGAVVNIGCAEGYYAVGTARLFPGTKVFAFDCDPRALTVVRENARLNGLEDQVEVGGACTSEMLLQLAISHSPLLVICDCEGYEAQIFLEQNTQAQLREVLRHSDLIIECHDFINSLSTAVCFAMFGATHLIENVYGGGRNPNVFPFLSGLHEIERWIAVCENRPCLMNWLVCKSRQPLP